MTSKIVVNNIEADAGVSTVTFNSNVQRGSSNLHSTGLALGAGSTVGAVTGVTTYYGDGSQLSGISVDSTKIETGNTKVETIDTGSDGHIKFTTEGGESIRIQSDGDVGIGTINNTNNERLRVQDDASTSTSCQVSIISGSAERSILNFGDKEDPNIGRVSYHNNTNTLSLFTNNTERLLISSEGYVTNPARPCFDVAKDNGAVSSTNAIVFNVVNVNNGSHYNSSNGRFTAPVTGTYFLYFGGIKNNTNSVIRLKLLKNGTGSYMNSDRELRMDDGDAYGENASMNVIVSLTATDYVQVYVTEGTIYGTDPSYTHFGGYLLS